MSPCRQSDELTPPEKVTASNHSLNSNQQINKININKNDKESNFAARFSLSLPTFILNLPVCFLQSYLVFGKTLRIRRVRCLFSQPHFLYSTHFRRKEIIYFYTSFAHLTLAGKMTN